MFSGARPATTTLPLASPPHLVDIDLLLSVQLFLESSQPSKGGRLCGSIPEVGTPDPGLDLHVFLQITHILQKD